MNRTVLIIGIVGAAALVGVLFMGLGKNPAEIRSPLVGKPAPVFALREVGTQRTVDITQYRGKPLVVNFWATWCGPCKAAMPSLQSLHEKYQGKAVEIIGVNVWEKGEKLGPDYMKDKGFTYSCLLKGDDLAKAYGIRGIPTLVLIDTDGTILHTGVGFGPNEEEHLAEMIDKELTRKN
jgi:cytochrome c biogenesis protein CcmG/thiol:disulfide interchange protein DsbE